LGEKLQIGCIGAGGRASSLAKRFASDPNAEIVALCDNNVTRLENLCDAFKRHNGIDIHPYTDYRVMLEDPSIDTVVIATPDFLHSEMAVAAFEAGKHVFLEKPAGINFSQAYEVVQAAQKSGKILEIGYTLRYTPFFERIKQFLESGEIGNPIFADIAEYYHGGSHFFRDWHALKKNIGGIVIQKNCHDFDLLYWMFGRPVRVAAFGSKMEFRTGGWPSDAAYCRDCKNHCPYYKALSDPEEANQEMPPDLCVYNFDHEIEDNIHAIVQFENGLNAHLGVHFFPSLAQSDRHWRVNCSKAELTGRVDENWLRVDPRFDTTRSQTRYLRFKGGGGGSRRGRLYSIRCFYSSSYRRARGKSGNRVRVLVFSPCDGCPRSIGNEPSG